MTATVHPIFPDPKRAQAIADKCGLILLADGTMVREYRYDADDAVALDIVALFRNLNWRPDHNGPEAA